MKDKVRLICQLNGSDKFYEMEQKIEGTFDVFYGRIGAAPQTKTYHISDWQKKYNEKINKGYKDISESIVKFSLEDVFANLDKLELKLSEKG